MILLSSNVGEEGRKSDINDRVSPRDNVRRVSSPFPLLLRPASCLWMFHTRFYRRRDRLPPSVQRRGDPFNFISPAPPLSCALHPRRREKGAPGPRFTSSLRPSRSVLPPLQRDATPFEPPRSRRIARKLPIIWIRTPGHQLVSSEGFVGIRKFPSISLLQDGIQFSF